MANILTVYYSRKGENYCNGSIGNLKKGNTEIVAEFIRNAVGGDLFEIDTVKTYSTDYYKCTDEAMAELKSKARPELKKYPDNIEKYEIIFIGYPNWWGTMPMAMFTLLEKYEWSGKKIMPFCTNEGSGMGSSEKDLASVCKGANVFRGLSVHGAEAAQSKAKVEAWAKGAMK